MQFMCIFYVLHKEYHEITGRPTIEILNKLSFTHIATCYTDISRSMANSKLWLAHDHLSNFEQPH